MEANALRIPVKPQKWLFLLNLVVQPPLAALFFWQAAAAESAGIRVFNLALGAFALVLLGFGILALARTWGKELEIVVTRDAIEVPMPVLGRVDCIPFSSIRSARRTETRTSVTSFWGLQIDYAQGDRKRGAVISSQLIGTEAFDRVCAILIERGVDMR